MKFAHATRFRQNTFTKFLPGSCRTLPANSSSKSAANISEDESSGSNCSTKESMCVDSSGLNNDMILFSWGGRPFSASVGNRDAVCGGLDTWWASSSWIRIAVGSSSQTSSQVAVSLAPCFINVLGPQAFLLVTLPGTAYTSRPCSRAQRAVMRVPLNSAASITRTPTLSPLMMRLRIGKFWGAAKVPKGNSVINAPFGSDNLFRKSLVFFGIDRIYSGAQHADSDSPSCERPAMRRSVHTTRQTAENHQTVCRQVGRQPLCHSETIRRGMTRAHDCNPRLR